MTKAETKTLLQLLEEVPDHREGNTINRIRFLDRLKEGNLMPRITIKQDDQKQRRAVSDAQKNFIMYCKLKNLAPYTIKYYEENLNFFRNSNRLIKKVDEINQEFTDSYTFRKTMFSHGVLQIRFLEMLYNRSMLASK